MRQYLPLMVEPNQKHILCVCTGNICRSPMAEQLLRHALAAESPPLRDLSVVSAGVAAYPGEPASRNSQIAVEKVGLTLEGHKSRMVNPELLDHALLILCMSESHRQALLLHFEDIEAPILLFRELLEEGHTDIPDPFGGSVDEYIACRDSMVEAIPSLLQYLREHHSS